MSLREAKRETKEYKGDRGEDKWGKGRLRVRKWIIRENQEEYKY